MKIKINEITVEVKDIKTDSRKVENGDLFIAYKGVKNDAHDYIPSAIEKGASVVVGERSKDDVQVPSDVQYFQVRDGREFWAEAEAQKNDNPQNKLKLIGVTGTDGKTTTTNFIYTILEKAGFKVGMISTVAAKYSGQTKDTGLHVTSPDPDVLFKFLKEMVDANIEYVVLETTSHGLKHKRVHGIHFAACAVTNVTPEHLDEHGTYEQLIKDKSKIFEMSDAIFLNRNGAGFDQLKSFVPTDKKLFLVEALNIDLSENFPGEYNKQNASLAYELTKHLGVSEEIISNALKTANPPQGRFQFIENKLGINLIVDFAHTENSMRQVLNAVRAKRKNDEKIIVVFGCAGERDNHKRPAMGKTSSELADIVIVTSEDPRSEKPEDIIDQVVSGNPGYPYIKESDRAKAIEKGIKSARVGDWVLILGKGHERSMNIAGVEHEWLDEDVAKKVLSNL